MTDYISRADAIEAVADAITEERSVMNCGLDMAIKIIKTLPSADAEPKWNCTANFVAEQLDRLRKMTDEEKWEFFKKFFEIKGGGSE